MRLTLNPSVVRGTRHRPRLCVVPSALSGGSASDREVHAAPSASGRPSSESSSTSSARPNASRPQPMMGVNPPEARTPLDQAKEFVDGLPVYAKVPGGLLVLLITTRVIGMAVRASKRSGSMGSLRERGISYEDDQEFDDKYFKKVMKGVNTVPVDPLPEEVVKAARERRRQELKYEPVNLEDVELPPDHPFFVKKSLSEEEEALIEARVRLRRGAPIKDLTDPRIQQLKNGELGGPEEEERGGGSVRPRGGGSVRPRQ